MTEIFKQIPFHKKYYASNVGKIYAAKTMTDLIQTKTVNGYMMIVSLINTKTKKYKSYNVHRLIKAETFRSLLNIH